VPSHRRCRPGGAPAAALLLRPATHPSVGSPRWGCSLPGLTRFPWWRPTACPPADRT